jgi:hypothetical protein
VIVIVAPAGNAVPIFALKTPSAWPPREAASDV